MVREVHAGMSVITNSIELTMLLASLSKPIQLKILHGTAETINSK